MSFVAISLLFLGSSGRTVPRSRLCASALYGRCARVGTTTAMAAVQEGSAAQPAALSEWVAPEALTLQDLEGYWELEEAEDDCTAHTLLHILPGGQLEFGKTDGPLPTEVLGSWRVTDSELLGLELRVSRTFAEVRFPYDVERKYAGSLVRDGPLVLVQGPIQIMNQGSEEINAGFFQLTKVPDFPGEEVELN